MQDARIEVWCGMILGFDNDDATIFDAQARVHPRRSDREHDDRDALTQSLEPRCMRGWWPKGGSIRRMEPEYGTNVIPLKISREELRDGYVNVMRRPVHVRGLLRPADAQALMPRSTWDKGGLGTGAQHPWAGLKTNAMWTVQSIGLYIRMMRGIPKPPSDAGIASGSGT